MSNRSLLEFNHDNLPEGDAETLAWANQLRAYLATGDRTALPRGVAFKHSRHHADPCPMDRYSGRYAIGDKVSVAIDFAGGHFEGKARVVRIDSLCVEFTWQGEKKRIHIGESDVKCQTGKGVKAG
jgi:hypothetical protein